MPPPYKWSRASAGRLATVHADLRTLFDRVLTRVDCTVLPHGGSRTPSLQARLVAEGRSQRLDSLHVVNGSNELSRAIDVSPYPVLWPDQQATKRERALARARFYYFGGYVKGVADELGLRIKWGGDWDGDFDLLDQTFNDLCHWELVS